MKRLFDILFSLSLLILLAPILLLISILIKLTSKGPIIFKQIRVGKSNSHFAIYKFRTMIIDAEKKGLQLTVGKRDPRVTSIGHILRTFKLDELPQFLNVLKGEMSVVGPRPEVPKYVELYNSEQQKILNIRPGITDLASLKFINESELMQDKADPESFYISDIMPIKLKINLDYLDNQSLLFDLKIILFTFLKILGVKYE